MELGLGLELELVDTAVEEDSVETVPVLLLLLLPSDPNIVAASMFVVSVIMMPFTDVVL